MMNFQFNLPTNIVLKTGIVRQVAGFLPLYRISKPLILTDKGINKAGLLQGIIESLTNENIDFAVYDDVQPNPKDKYCGLAADFARVNNVDGIIAVGGGSVLDTAKALGILLTHDGVINDWEGDNTLQRDITPLICIPTTAGTGSEATNIAVITDTERKVKMGIVDDRIAPKLSLLDPELTKGLPASITASTGMDALTHAIEAYTSRSSSPVTDALALHAIRLIKDYFLEAVQNGANMEARENILSASLMAGIAFSQSNVGSVHCISEAAGGLYDAPHGVLNSIFLPYVFEFNMEANLEKHADVAYALGVDQNLPVREASKEGAKLLFEMVEKVGIPKFSDLPAVDPKDFAKLAKTSKETPMDADNVRSLTVEDYLTIIKNAYNSNH
ncbi:iron-containing alcohol dehydrogenase [Siminovitchia terrae]|uniref:Iron-containing alcohol dehydrogenase n=2 Tax=Siminovitchia terrae TaxID=1914933 RepID=A0A429X6Y6_SIMTE|nr:iron-containing alcohol dehydrogenase [Siminovitchia terrae]